MLLSDRRRTLAILTGAIPLATPTARAAADPFAAWLDELRREASRNGIGAAVLDAAFAGVRPIPSVIEADRRQPEGRMTFAEYRRRVVSADRIERGRELMASHAPLLRRVEDRYGVPPEVMVALWGIESNFGQRQGSYSVFGALATLAFEGRRAAFFRRELLSALTIADKGYADAAQMRGSWAGAMGQNQFMPSTYLGYAVDFDGDGRRDIWASLPDVFASMSNYLDRSGWNASYIWGREVHAPESIAASRVGLDHRAPLATWERRGVRLPDGAALPRADIEASLLRMDGGMGPSYLAYGNFRALMAWNRSTYFGVSVGLLSDSLKDGWRS
jgi:membrane-bound lytic murein transglycosylase B